MKQPYEDGTYTEIKSKNKVGKMWPKMWAYIYREHHWTPNEFFKQWPNFMEDYYFKFLLNQLSDMDEFDEEVMRQTVDECILDNQTRKKKRLITKIL